MEVSETMPVAYCNHCNKFFYTFEDLYMKHQEKPLKSLIMEESVRRRYRTYVKEINAI